MTFGIFHRGSGIGNQLHRFVATRFLAKENNEDYGMVAPDLFKGKDFLQIDYGKPNYDYRIEEGTGKVIPNNTTIQIIDGEFQNEKYFSDRDWLDSIIKTRQITLADNLCIINFRGGEYVGIRELFLTEEYWNTAIKMMLEERPDMEFEVHTDDPATARLFFPDYKIVSGMEINWLSVRYANYLILSNSSFAIIPAHMGNAKKIIAPMFWARRNTKEWHNPDNYYQRFTHI